MEIQKSIQFTNYSYSRCERWRHSRLLRSLLLAVFWRTPPPRRETAQDTTLDKCLRQRGMWWRCWDSQSQMSQMQPLYFFLLSGYLSFLQERNNTQFDLDDRSSQSDHCSQCKVINLAHMKRAVYWFSGWFSVKGMFLFRNVEHKTRVCAICKSAAELSRSSAKEIQRFSHCSMWSRTRQNDSQSA